MIRAIVFDYDAVNILSSYQLEDAWIEELGEIRGASRVQVNEVLYFIGPKSKPSNRLLVIRCIDGALLPELPQQARLECFQRILRATLSEFLPSLVKLPVSWRPFHSGSLLSFQTNRITANVAARVYVDVAPEGTNCVYAYHISSNRADPLTRANYDADLFSEAVLGFSDVFDGGPADTGATGYGAGHVTIALDEQFGDVNVMQGIPFSTWRDSKLTRSQRNFFDANFIGPLRVRGPAGSGKTLVLSMRFLKEIYTAADAQRPFRGCFLTHGEETSNHILRGLLLLDERGVILDREKYPDIYVEVSTLHGLADNYINRDSENVAPLSLDGSEGRKLQFEIILSLVNDFVSGPWLHMFRDGCREDFIKGIEAPPGEARHRAFCCDLSDEFANVLETLGVRAIDEITKKYLLLRPAERSLARNGAEKRVVLELYRDFRRALTELGVVSLDQFTADFLAYLNSFRWEALRKEKGFDIIFADELHLFNAQERRVLGFLLRTNETPKKVAVAYDPRQSPRNSFFPHATTERDSVWTEAGLQSPSPTFELRDVFRYTPEILAFLSRLNQHFPGSDLAEDWSLTFGTSQIASGDTPSAFGYSSQKDMIDNVLKVSKNLLKGAVKGEHIAVLCLDHDRFQTYREAGVFQSNFVVVSGRDEIGAIERFRQRAVLSMPEYVAGLQFKSVLLVDANANLVAELGGGVNGLHTFISSVYLGASRAQQHLEIHSDLTEGGFAEPIRDAITAGLIKLKQPR
ncbi:hypothetical protein [Dongia sp.]|uniref:hypothetical protein n=1 Tax=Dongia sp. TaxID=1977262 RepID=UPI0035AFBF75